MTSEPKDDKIFSYTTVVVFYMDRLAQECEKIAQSHDNEAAYYDQMAKAAVAVYESDMWKGSAENEKALAEAARQKAKLYRKRVRLLYQYAAAVNPYTKEDIAMIERIPNLEGIGATMYVSDKTRLGVNLMSSQRVFTLVSVVLVSVIITVIAVAQGHVIDIGVTGLTESVLALLVPLTAAASSLRSFYSVLDEEIVSGRLDANAIPPLFGMSAYWTVLVLWIATTVQVIGLDIINNDTQTLFVAGLTTLGGVLLDSFSKRANGATSYSLKMGDKSAGAAYRSPAGDHRHG